MRWRHRRRPRWPAAATAALAAALALGTTRAAAITVVWDSTSTPYAGLTVRRGHSVSPTHYFRAAFVELCHDYVHVTATSPPSSRRTAGSWGSSAGVQLAINGDFFKYETPPPVYGDAVGGGVRWPSWQTGVGAPSSSWYYLHYGWIAFGHGWVEFSHTQWTKEHAAEYEAAGYTVRHGWRPTAVTTDIPAGTLALVSGFPELVIEGRVKSCPDPASSSCFPDRGDMHSGHRRSAMGLSRDKRTFILVATESSSVYGETLAAIMAEIGAWEAFNIDGGGSTQMWLDGTGYLVSSTRAVANHWGVFAGSGSGKPPLPTSCDPCVQQTELCNGKDDNCNGQLDEGFDLQTDPANCGACGTVCAFPHAGGSCSAGSCVMGSCHAGWVDLDGAAANGCEYDCPVWPIEVERCNNADDDCDGEIDEGTCDRAAPVDSTGPDDWPACAARAVTLRMRNTGGTTWGGGEGLGLRFLGGDLLAPDVVAVTGTVAPDQIAAFDFTAVAGETEGEGSGRWSMARDGALFGEEATLSFTIATPPYRARLVDLSYPSVLAEGDEVLVWVTFRNTGTEPWHEGGVVLGTVPPERASGLWTDAWPAFDVPARVAERVAPDATTSLRFPIRMSAEAVDDEEIFGLRTAGGEVFSCADSGLTLSLDLARPETDPSDPVVTEEGGMPEEGCSCRVASGGSQPWSLWAFALGLVLRRGLRRRRALAARTGGRAP